MVSWSRFLLPLSLLTVTSPVVGPPPGSPGAGSPTGTGSSEAERTRSPAASLGSGEPRRQAIDTVSAALDSVMHGQMERGHIPGGALVVVVEGEIAFARGYGTADLASGRPVLPDSTRFPLGSLSKLVTATAVLQLARSGRVALDAPVRSYLGPDAVPDGPGGEITLHHLLTHTAGFEPANLGVATREPESHRGLDAYLSSNLPRRARAPGELYVYSQHGYGLLGRVVETVSGRDFPAYVRDEIFAPLGMSSAALRRTEVPDGTVATGYYGGERLRPAPAVYHRIPPAGGLVATPVDVARLMAAHLAGGGPVLDETSTRRMHRRQWSPHPDPAVEGTSYGLFEYRACGERALMSRGWVGGHASYVHLVPELGTGFVITTNASELDGLDQRLREVFHVHLSGGACGEGSEDVVSEDGGREAGPPPGDDSPAVTGSYRSIGYGTAGVEGLGRYLLSPVLSVRRENGGLVIDFGGETAELVRSDARLYRASWWEGRDQNFAFLGVVEGRPRYMMWGGEAYERVSRLAHPRALWAGLVLAGLVFFGSVVFAAVRGARSLAAGRGVREARGTGLESLPWWLALAVSVLFLVFGTGMAAELAGTARYRFAFGVPTSAEILLWALSLAALLTLFLVGSAVPVWRTGSWSLPRRLHWTAITVAALAVAAAAATVGLVPPP